MSGNTAGAYSCSTDLIARNDMQIDNDNVAYDEYFVRASDTDMFYSAALPFYFDAMQEMGGEHAARMGVAIADLMREKNWTWVITRTRAIFHHLDKWQDTVRLESWPQKGYKLYCPRVVNGYGKDGSPSFEAMTLWALIDLNRNRPLRPSEVESSFTIPPEDKHWMDPDIGKIEKFDDATLIERWPIHTPVPTYFDIDYNRHINNVVYVRWMVSAMDEEFLKSYEPAVVDVQWEHQTFRGDKIHVETGVVSNDGSEARLVHCIRKDDGTIVFEANTRWRKKDQ